MAAFSQIIDDTMRELYAGKADEPEVIGDLRFLRDKFKRRMEQIGEIKARVDKRTEEEGGVSAVRAREAAAAEREEAERTAKEAEQADEMRGMREAAEGALARAGESEGFDMLEPPAHRAVFAPATPGAGGGDRRAADPPRAAEAVAGGQGGARALARLCRRLLARGRSGGGGANADDGEGPSPMDADDDDENAAEDEADEDDDAAAVAEAAVAAVVSAYPFCPGAAAADARALAAGPGGAEAAGRGCLRVLASPATAASTAVVLGAGVSLLARMGARDPELAAGSDAPSSGDDASSAQGLAAVAPGILGGGPASASAGNVWLPAAPDFVALFRALGYGAAFVEAGGVSPGDGPAAAAAAAAPPPSSCLLPTPRGAAALQLALRALRRALELGGAAAVLQAGTAPSAASSPAAAWASAPEACASALVAGLLRLRLDPSARAVALPALDAALGALLAAVPARDWPRVCGSAGSALLGAPVAPSHRAALMLLQELPTGVSPRAVQLQASGALALLRTVAQCLRTGGGDFSALEPGAGGGDGAEASHGGGGGSGGAGKRKRADGPAPSMWPTPQEVMSALGQARVLLAAVNVAGVGGAGAGGAAAAAGGAAGAQDEEDGDGAAATAAAAAPASKTGTAAAYWAAITAVDAADMILWAHVDGALARARAAEDGGGGGVSAAPTAAPTGGWTRTANAAWAKWLVDAGKQVRSISLHALRARLSELEYTYELVAGAVARV